MNRRGFLKFLGGGATLGAVAAVAPSQVWPFTKIFLPSAPAISAKALMYQEHLNALISAQADLFTEMFYLSDPLYRALKREYPNLVDDRPRMRVPIRREETYLGMANGSKIIFDPNIESPYRAKPDLAVSEVLSSLDRDIADCLRPVRS